MRPFPVAFAGEVAKEATREALRYAIGGSYGDKAIAYPAPEPCPELFVNYTLIGELCREEPGRWLYLAH